MARRGSAKICQIFLISEISEKSEHELQPRGRLDQGPQKGSGSLGQVQAWSEHVRLRKSGGLGLRPGLEKPMLFWTGAVVHQPCSWWVQWAQGINAIKK